MFGPFPMAAMEGPCDQNKTSSPSFPQSPGRKSMKSIPKSKTSSASLSPRESVSPPTSPTVTSPSGADSEHPAVRNLTPTPGNAFSLIAFEAARVRALHPELDTEVLSSYEELLSPPLLRKSSWQLDYDQELAIPMPKPRQRKYSVPEKTPPVPEEPDEMKVPGFKKRAATDPASAGHSVSEPPSAELSKKRSKMELIKNRLSFKDLRKESLKAEISPPIPLIIPDILTVPLPETVQARGRRPLPRSGIPTMSPSADDLPPKLRPVELSKYSSIGLPTGFMSQANIASSKIPLPPSKTLSNVQGTMAPMATMGPVRSASQRIGGPVSRNITPSEKVDNKESPVTNHKLSTPTSAGKSGHDNVVTHPSPAVSVKEHEHKPSAPPVSTLHDPITEDSSSTPLDLPDGTDEVKYPQLNWTMGEEGTVSPTPLPKSRVPIPHEEDEASVESSSESMMSSQESLQQTNIQLDKPGSKESQDHCTAVHVDDILDMVLTHQRQTEMGMQNLDRRIDELTTWMADQLKNVLDSVSEGARTTSELLAKFYELSKENMKFQLNVRTEVSLMARRFNAFEVKVLDELQNEVRALARALEVQEQLTLRYEARHERLLSEYQRTQRLLEELQRKQVETEAQLEETKNKCMEILAFELKATTLKSADIGGATLDYDSKASTPVSVKTIQPVASQEGNDESTPRSTQATTHQSSTHAKQTEPGPISPVPAAHAPLAPPRVRASTPSKSPRIPRSVSLPKRAFLKNAKDAASTTPPKEIENDKSPEGSAPTDDGKKWNVFGFRRRDSAGSGSNKFAWPASRRASTTNDGSSSRSSTPPVPAIPRRIPHWVEKTNALSISHPAHRAISMQNKPHEGDAAAEQKAPTAGATVQAQVIRDEGSARGSMPTSTRSSFVENKAASSSVVSPGSFHSAEDKPVSESTANNAVDDSVRAPLLGDTDQEWDRVSLRESRSRETVV